MSSNRTRDLIKVMNSRSSIKSLPIFNYINLLFNKCMPKNKNESNILFEEELDSLEEDWDFAYMEYMWYSVLKRSDDFFKVTPKTFFEQMDIYKKIKNIENEDVDYI